MTALVADRNTPMRDSDLVSYQMASGVKIFAGAIVCLNPNGNAVKLPLSSAYTYVGRAEETVDNTQNVGKSILVRRNKAFKFANEPTDPVMQASVGKCCYVFDDQTVAATAGRINSRPDCGIVVQVDSDGVWVVGTALDLRPFTFAGNSPSVAAGASYDQLIPYAGAALLDYVVLGLPAAPQTGIIFSAFVSAVNQVTLRMFNPTAAAIVVAGAEYTIAVQK